MWAMGMAHQPQLGYCRRMSAKVFAILTIIDDVYDVYGSLDELQLFTDAFHRLIKLLIFLSLDIKCYKSIDLLTKIYITLIFTKLYGCSRETVAGS